MSVAPPQPGWWMASDGNWYPPEQHPYARQGWWMASDGNWYPPEQHLVDTTTFAAYPGGARPEWEKSVGGGERKGLRTERSAGNFLVRSVIMIAWFGGFLYFAIVNPKPWWLLVPALTIGVPMMGKKSMTIFTYRYIKKIWEEAHRATGYADAGIGWAKRSPGEILMLNAALWIAIAAVGCGLLGDALFAKAQLAGTSKGEPSINKMIQQMTPNTTTTTLTVSNPEENQLNQIEQLQKNQQQQIQKLLNGAAG